MMRPLGLRLRAFARGTRAAAGIELAIGSVVLLSVAAASFDLYNRVEADTVGAQLAATMADYVSRGPDEGETTIDGDALKALGTFLHERVLGDDNDLVFVVSALRQGAGSPPPAVEVLWSESERLRFGDGAANLACTSRFVEKNANNQDVAKLPLPADFTMAAGEVLVVAEVCLDLANEGALSGLVVGPVYRLHVLPLRSPEKNLPAPTYARLDAGAWHAKASGAGPRSRSVGSRPRGHDVQFARNTDPASAVAVIRARAERHHVDEPRSAIGPVARLRPWDVPGAAGALPSGAGAQA